MLFFFPSNPDVRRRTGILLVVVCLFIVVYVPRFLSLDAHWSSDEVRWLNRSSQFISAVEQGKFSKTRIAYHPGVTTMWLAGLRTFFIEPEIDIPNLVRARCFIGITVCAGIGVAGLLLYQLIGKWVALTSVACFAYSPLFLAQTRRVHTDAIAAIFCLLTVLLFLCYCQNKKHCRTLIFSAVAFGLAVLSKSYALILLPWIPFCLFLFRNSGKNTPWIKSSLIVCLCFLSCSLLTVIIVWPIFWTPTFGLLAVCLFGAARMLSNLLKQKKLTLRNLSFYAAAIIIGIACIRIASKFSIVFYRVGRAVTTPHEVEHFFFGHVVNDPGWLFYPIVLTIKSTPLVLPLVLLGGIMLWKHRKQTQEASRQFRILLALVAGVILFTVCLSATSKKFSRYLLPAFVMLEIAAAIGFVEILKWCHITLGARIGTARAEKYKVTLTVFACVGFFFIQILPVFALHPYYGTYYNLAWKGTNITKVITVGDASGLDIAAKYLRAKPKPKDRAMRVQVSPLTIEFFMHYFDGLVKPSDREGGPPPDYEVVYIRDSQIGRVPQTGTLNGELEAIITLNGIDHVWIYHIPSQETP